MSILIFLLPVKFVLLCRVRNIGANMSSNGDMRETEESKQTCVYVYLEITEECNWQAILLTFSQGFKSLPSVCLDVQNSLLRLCLKPIWKNAMGKNCMMLLKNCEEKGKRLPIWGSRIKARYFLKQYLSIYLFIWLQWVFLTACRIFSCGMWDVVPWLGIEPGIPAFGVWSLSHWATR